jgi:hypothetical protein
MKMKADENGAKVVQSGSGIWDQQEPTPTESDKLRGNSLVT